MNSATRIVPLAAATAKVSPTCVRVAGSEALRRPGSLSDSELHRGIEDSAPATRDTPDAWNFDPMDIAGIGTQVVECLRVRKLIDKHGELFLRQVYTDRETRQCNAKK